MRSNLGAWQVVDASLVDWELERSLDRERSRRRWRSSCDRLASHRGRIIAGKRAARSRTILQLRLPAPITMEARSSNTGTLPARSNSPVASRLRRCREGAPCGATPAEIDDSLESVGCCLPGESSSAVAFALFVACTGPHFVNEVDRGGRASERLLERLATLQIEMYPPGARPVALGTLDVSRSAADVYFFRRKKTIQEVTSDEPACSRDENRAGSRSSGSLYGTRSR